MTALLTDELRAKLQDNGRRQRDVRGTKDEIDFVPVMRLYTPLMKAIWLLTEIDPKNADKAIGLHDPGNGPAELCTVSLSGLQRRFAQQSVRRDEGFETDEPLSVFARKAGLGRSSPISIVRGSRL